MKEETDDVYNAIRFGAEFNEDNDHHHHCNNNNTYLVINVIPFKIVFLGLYTMSPVHPLLETWLMSPITWLESW